jgi:type IV pilus modification protein PilV
MRGRGFTLLESLVALVVLSVGLLGAAATLLGSLAAHAEALHRAIALELVRDTADRIRANSVARAAYDTRNTALGADCAASACGAEARAALDRAHFIDAARAAFPFADTRAEIRFEPATGPATPDRYEITLRFPPRSRPGAMDGVALTMLVFVPVAGAPMAGA